MSTPSSCPFCNIASTYPPIPPTAFTPDNAPPNSQNTTKPYTSLIPLPDASDPTQPTAHLILSTKHVLAFLDIMPLTRGHVLVIPRTHYEKLGDVDVKVSREVRITLLFCSFISIVYMISPATNHIQLGQWLPILSRVVMRTISGDQDSSSDWNWNVVQNNGIVPTFLPLVTLMDQLGSSVLMVKHRSQGRAAGSSCPFSYHSPAVV